MGNLQSAKLSCHIFEVLWTETPIPLQCLEGVYEGLQTRDADAPPRRGIVLYPPNGDINKSPRRFVTKIEVWRRFFIRKQRYQHLDVFALLTSFLVGY